MQQNNQISITRALSELKTLDSRIQRLTETKWVAAAINKKIGNIAVDAFTTSVKAAKQQLTDLMERRNKIKCAIVQSNAVTKVTVGNVEYTVAEAIERKNTIQQEEAFVLALRAQLNTSNAAVEKHNLNANAQLNTLLGQMVSKEAAVPQESVNALSESFREQNFASLVDPLGADKLIEDLQNTISEFKMNVDFSLSEINAVTKITV
jgi:hypothetical protein